MTTNSFRTSLIIVSLLAIALLALWGLGDALTPLLISFLLAYLLFPLIQFLEKKGISRQLAVSGVFLSSLIFLGLVVALILPGLINDSKVLMNELPKSSAHAFQKVENFAQGLGLDLKISKDTLAGYIKEHLSELSGNIIKGLTDGIQSSFSSAVSWILAILNFFLIPLFFFYVIHDYEKIVEGLQSFIPLKARPKLSRYLALCNQVLSGYVRGQLLVALSLGVLYALGLSIVGLRFGVLIGLFSGLISIIPYAGFTLGFLTAITIALANDAGIAPLLGVCAVYIVVQALEGTLITPKLVGNKVGLSSLATMLALIIGGNVMGLMGMLLAIPIAAIIKTLIHDLKSEYVELDFYKN